MTPIRRCALVTRFADARAADSAAALSRHLAARGIEVLAPEEESARHGDIDAIAWHGPNAAGTTHAVGGKLANPWGFHDMLGNVWEWTADRYGDYTASAVTDPRGATSGSYRVQRGCHWGYFGDTIRASNRGVYGAAGRFGNIGFRVVRSAS